MHPCIVSYYYHARHRDGPYTRRSSCRPRLSCRSAFLACPLMLVSGCCLCCVLADTMPSQPSLRPTVTRSATPTTTLLLIPSIHGPCMMKAKVASGPTAQEWCVTGSSVARSLSCPLTFRHCDIRSKARSSTLGARTSARHGARTSSSRYVRHP